MDKLNQARILKQIRDEVREVADQFIARPYTTENSKELSRQLKGNLDNWINSLGLNHVYTGCEVVSIEDGVANINVKTNLLELKKAVEEIDKKIKRQIQLLTGLEWKNVEIEELRDGDTFRVLENGVPLEAFGRYEHVADGDAYYDEENWCVDVEQ